MLIKYIEPLILRQGLYVPPLVHALIEFPALYAGSLLILIHSKTQT
jgi:hypothetical protein